MGVEPVTSPSITGDRQIGEIVLPIVAGSLHDRGVPLAASLAQTWNVPMRLVHVADSSSPPDVAESTLTSLRQWYPSVSMSYSCVLSDETADFIAALLERDSLAVVSTDRITKWRFDHSTAEALVEASETPMILVGPNVTKGFVRTKALSGDIVVTLDGSLAAESALNSAVALARSLGCRLWLLTVQNLSVPLPSDAGMYLQSVTDRLKDTVDVRWEVIRGAKAGEAIEAFAARKNIGLIVVGSRNLAQSNHRFSESMATGLVEVSERPVLITKVAAAPSLATGA